MRVGLFLSILFTLFLAASLSAQQPGPPPGAVPAGAGDKNLQTSDLKMRSAELERIKRDAEKPSRKNEGPAAPTMNFQQIKEDFETIQKLQDDIIKAYSTGKEIEHTRISNDASQMNQSAIRLESNLFPPVEKKKDGKKGSEPPSAKVDEPALPQDIKSLIVELDNTLTAFVGNPMFTSPQVVDQNNNLKARGELQKLIRLSSALQNEAGKLRK